MRNSDPSNVKYCDDCGRMATLTEDGYCYTCGKHADNMPEQYSYPNNVYSGIYG